MCIRDRYYLVHFKELFALDGKHANLTSNDVQRRNRIAQLLADWWLVGVVDVVRIQDIAPLNQIKVLSYKDKGDWILETKYNIGAKKKKTDEEGWHPLFLCYTIVVGRNMGVTE